MAMAIGAYENVLLPHEEAFYGMMAADNDMLAKIASRILAKAEDWKFFVKLPTLRHSFDDFKNVPAYQANESLQVYMIELERMGWVRGTTDGAKNTPAWHISRHIMTAFRNRAAMEVEALATTKLKIAGAVEARAKEKQKAAKDGE